VHLHQALHSLRCFTENATATGTLWLLQTGAANTSEVVIRNCRIKVPSSEKNCDGVNTVHRIASSFIHDLFTLICANMLQQVGLGGRNLSFPDAWRVELLQQIPLHFVEMLP
jgi:hypothetical protein